MTGSKAQIAFSAIVGLLEADADALAAAFSVEQKRQLGDEQRPTPLDRAMWATDPDMIEWQKQERERAGKLAEWHDPNQLAAEVRE